jgi:hypothetical protein
MEIAVPADVVAAHRLRFTLGDQELQKGSHISPPRFDQRRLFRQFSRQPSIRFTSQQSVCNADARSRNIDMVYQFFLFYGLFLWIIFSS